MILDCNGKRLAVHDRFIVIAADPQTFHLVGKAGTVWGFTHGGRVIWFSDSMGETFSEGWSVMKIEPDAETKKEARGNVIPVIPVSIRIFEFINDK